MDASIHQLQMTQIKHRIDGLMDLLYGAGVASHHTIIEQINYLMFLRALTKRDDEAIKIDNADKLLFTGSFEKYRWDNLLMLNAEDLFTTLEKIYRELPEITPDSTVSLLYRDAHVKIYEKPTLRRLLHEIEKLMSELEADAKQGSKDIFGDMYEYLLSKQAQAGTMGQFRTPRHIIKFITEIIDPSKGETILDPACGTAGFLVAAFKVLQQKYTSEKFKKEERYPMDLLDPKDRKFVYEHTFTGFDSDSDMIKFGLMNLYLHQLEHPQIIRQNTLVDTAGNRDKWNIILANPPFSGALDKDSISEDLRMGTRATEILFLRYMIDHLKDNGRAGVIVPEGVIFSNSTAHKKIRQALVDDAGLWCVVSLPAGIFNPYAGVKTSILFFDKFLKEKSKDILFVKIENDGFDLGAQKRPIDKNDLPQALEGIKKYREFLLTGATQNDLFLTRIRENEAVGEIIRITHDKLSLISKKLISKDGDYNLSSDRYKIEKILSNNKWPLIALGDKEYFQVESGGTPNSSIKEYWEGNIDWTTLVDLPQNNFITEIYNTKRKITDNGLKNSSAKLIPIDSVLVSTRATIGRIAINKIPLATNQGFKNIIINDFSLANPYYVAYMLTSRVEEMIRNASGGTFKEISKSNFEKIKIPLPPLEIQQQIVNELEGYQKIISGAKQVVENWKPTINIDPTWEKVKIGEICKIERGASPRPIDKFITSDPKGLPWVRIGDTKNSNKYITQTEEKITKEGAEKSRKVQVGDFVLSNSMSFGRPYIMKIEGYVHDGWLRLSEDSSRITKDYLYYILSSEMIKAQFENAATGGVVRNLNSELVKNVKIPLPPVETQKVIVNMLDVERELVEGNKQLVKIYEQKIKSRIAEVWEA